MGFIIGLAALTVIGYLIRAAANYLSVWELFGQLTLALSGIFLAVALVAVPIARAEYEASIDKHEVLKETIENARSSEDLSEFERASLTTKITEHNEDLASVKYWHDNPFIGVYIPEKVAELDYIE